jgi:hypothetical protein
MVAAFRSDGLKTVCVGRELSETMMALNGPLPPSSTTLDVAFGIDTLPCAHARFVKQIPMPSKTNNVYVFFIVLLINRIPYLT